MFFRSMALAFSGYAVPLSILSFSFFQSKKDAITIGAIIKFQ
jgi:hypothetical protein